MAEVATCKGWEILLRHQISAIHNKRAFCLAKYCNVNCSTHTNMCPVLTNGWLGTLVAEKLETVALRGLLWD